MSNVENYSTDLVCGRNRNDFTRNPLRETAHPFFLRKYSADRVSHTSAVDTTAHSIWRGKERRRMPTNPYRFDPHRSIQHPPPLPSSCRVYRGFCDPTPAPTSLLLHIPNLRIGRRTKRCAIDRHRFKPSNPFSHRSAFVEPRSRFLRKG